MNKNVSSAPGKKAVAICCSNGFIRDGIVKMLAKTNFKVIGEADDMAGIFENCSGRTPDLVIIDAVSERLALDAVAELARRVIVVLLVSKGMIKKTVEEALNAGVSGLITVDETKEDLRQMLDRIIAGDAIISNKLMQSLRSTTFLPTQFHKTAGLTSREAEVLGLAGNGMTNREIGGTLFISIHTVRSHMRSVMTKLDLQGRQEAITYAIEHGLTNEHKRRGDTS